MDTQRVIIVGCGEIGMRVAALWQARGNIVAGTARSAEKTARLREFGIEVIDMDLDKPQTTAKLACNDSLLYYFAPPAPTGHTDLRMRAFLETLTEGPAPEKIVYISTTGVYGDRQGAWVNEETPVNPQSARSRRRLDAETTLRGWGRQHQVPVVILRVPGIYGPGHLPVEAIRSRRSVVNEIECGFSNRIHADDLARVCVAAADRGCADTIYNASDGNPRSMTGYFNCVADALDLPRPPVVTRAEAMRILSPEMLSYLGESRRIDNRRMREELGVELLYPNLETGLRASTDTKKAE
ncbi:MAG: SDR family oxidoreductase [Acidiferrobacterales bacterium]